MINVDRVTIIRFELGINTVSGTQIARVLAVTDQPAGRERR
jgi:hypothetical protein